MTAVSGPRIRLYSTVRTAHLERAKALAPATIVFRVRRYDFDEEAAAGLDLRQAGLLSTFRVVWRLAPRQIEINEPLMLSSVAVSFVAVCAVRLRQVLGAPRALVVTYAIGNDDPFRVPATRLRSRIRRRIELAAARTVAGRVDRIAYGTSAAQAVYEARLPRLRSTTSALIPALPAGRVHEDSSRADRAGRITFLGAFVARKGLPQVLDAWETVRQERPGASLLVMGKGALEPQVRALADRDPRVRLEIDPSRSEIFEALESSDVLVLPSQPSPSWREQVGLPIVEGLSCGCEIVTTTETGLAAWLRDHGHRVIDRPDDVELLAAAIISAVDSDRSTAEIIGPLPGRDGRLVADDWMFAVDEADG